MFAEQSGEQLLDLALCGGFGIVFGLWLDLLTLLTPTRTPQWVVAVRDAAAVLIAAPVFFLLSLPLTAGRLRWYLFAGAGLGCWLYHVTLHRTVTATGARVRRWLHRAFDGFARINERVWRAPLRRRLAPLQKRITARKQARRSPSSRSKKSRRKRKTFKKVLKSAASLLYNKDE